MTRNAYNGFSAAQRNRAGRWLAAEYAAGRRARPTSCEACGATTGIRGHSEDYSEPFGPHVGQFALCHACHLALHRVKHCLGCGQIVRATRWPVCPSCLSRVPAAISGLLGARVERRPTDDERRRWIVCYFQLWALQGPPGESAPPPLAVTPEEFEAAAPLLATARLAGPPDWADLAIGTDAEVMLKRVVLASRLAVGREEREAKRLYRRGHAERSRRIVEDGFRWAAGEAMCPLKECHRVFLMKRPNQIYCTPAHEDRDGARRRRAARP